MLPSQLSSFPRDKRIFSKGLSEGGKEQRKHLRSEKSPTKFFSIKCLYNEGSFVNLTVDTTKIFICFCNTGKLLISKTFACLNKHASNLLNMLGREGKEKQRRYHYTESYRQLWKSKFLKNYCHNEITKCTLMASSIMYH